MSFAPQRVWSGKLAMPPLPPPVPVARPLLMDEPRLFADVLQSFVRSAVSYFGTMRHVAAREIGDLGGDGDLVVIVGNEMPYRTKTGEPVTEMIDGFLGRGGSLLLLGPRFPPIDITAHYHGGAQMGQDAGMFWWKVWDEGQWKDFDPRDGETIPAPDHDGTVYWGGGPLFAAWEHGLGLFGFETPCRGVFDVEGGVVDPDQRVEVVYTDWTVRKPWAFTPLAFTEREHPAGHRPPARALPLRGPAPERGDRRARGRHRAVGLLPHRPAPPDAGPRRRNTRERLDVWHAAPARPPIRRYLPVNELGATRVVVGAVAGLAFAASFYAASLTVAVGSGPVLQNDPASYVDRVRQRNELRSVEDQVPVPVILTDAVPETPGWAAPLWAGLSAAFGQSITLSVWFFRLKRRGGLRPQRSVLHARGGIATGLMWIGVVPLVLVKFWLIYVVLVAGGNAWLAAFGEPVPRDPFLSIWPYGAALGLLVVLVTLEPWRGLQLDYRCSRWPALGLAVTTVLGAALYTLGRWLVPGAV